MSIRTEHEVWRDEIETPKRSIPERMAAWFNRTPPEPTEPLAKPLPELEPYRWYSVEEMIALSVES